MSIRDQVWDHLKAHQEITTKDLERYADGDRRKMVTANRFLQADKSHGREWNWLRYNAQGELLKPKQAWFLKRLRKPIKQTTVFK